MAANLWDQNRPKDFWQCIPPLNDDLWNEAVQCALPILRLNPVPANLDELLSQTLGEYQFGADHWRLSLIRQLYYVLKPLLPRILPRFLRRTLQKQHKRDLKLSWPIEARYPSFQFAVLKNLLELSGRKTIHFRPLWPNKARLAFVLTHDIETADGQELAEIVADLEEDLGFHSLFNFVPEKYKLNYRLMDNLRQRGFEIGVHGLKHDGRLFSSKSTFMQKTNLINKYLKDWKATGFRAELTHRQPEWMQALEIEYDLSFFDTDPFEPIPGGTMSIWPFFTGHFVELPYTLVQDYTLISVLGETTPKIWFEKVDFIEKYHGMALVNSHPDYLSQKTNWNVYHEFLNTMKKRKGFWHALPREAARWWRNRTINDSLQGGDASKLATASLRDGELVLDVSTLVQG